MRATSLLIAALMACAVLGSHAQKVTNACEEKCKSAIKPICVEHYDTNCKPSWWGNPDIQDGRCMTLKDVPRVRKVMPNRCKYECIAKQYCWEAWTELEDVKVKLSKKCLKQWKEFGFAADEECQKC